MSVLSQCNAVRGEVPFTQDVVQKIVDQFRQEIVDVLLPQPYCQIEYQGTSQTWWYPRMDGEDRVIYGSIEMKPVGVKNNLTYIRVVCKMAMIARFWEELGHRLEDACLDADPDYFASVPGRKNIPAQARKENRKLGPEKLRFFRELLGFHHMMEHGIEKPLRGAPLEWWFDYYHQVNALAARTKLVDRYSLRELAQDYGLSYDAIRKRHIGCPICTKGVGTKETQQLHRRM